MTKTIENTHLPKDYYTAALLNGELVMTPHCACGNFLNEDYFCEKCNRHCHCYQIVCEDTATLELVQRYIRESSKFAVYTAVLAEKK
ncbi:MAG: hypothetical protein PVI06_03295 [Desulfobacterales bacterium]|jgi:hypothetical protein